MKKLLTVLKYVAIGVLAFSIGFFVPATIGGIIEFRDAYIERIAQVDTDIYGIMEGMSFVFEELERGQNNDNFLLDVLGMFYEDNDKKFDKLSEEIAKLKNEIPKPEPKPTYESLKAQTVYMKKKINAFQGATGTGVIVKKEGTTSYILTNRHVCNEYDKGKCFVEVYKYGQFLEIPLTLVKQSRTKYDMAVWKTSEILPNKKAIKGLKEAFPQDKIYSVGNYLGLKYIYTEGTFAGYELDYSLMNMPCVYGCSGSAVFDKDEYLVGLVFAVNVVSPLTGQVDTTKAITVPYEIIKLFLEGII
jgi:hypothetical protein